jgi:transcriptional regulator with XRE-family HTH domain
VGSREQTPLNGTDSLVGFARRLRGLRAEANLTLRQLADRSGYSASTLSVAEGGKKRPSWDVLEAYVQSCGEDPAAWRGIWETAVNGTEVADFPAEPAPRRRWVTRRRAMIGLAVLGLIAAIVGGLAMFTGSDPAAGPTSYTAVTGTGCVANDTQDGYKNDVEKGWVREFGGWMRDHCDGWYKYASPASPAANKQNSYTWWFKPRIDGEVDCTVELYIPASDLAANPQARYSVRTGEQTDIVGTFVIDQPANRGHWVTYGPYRVSGALMSVRVMADAPGTETTAVAAGKVSCVRV